jgi:hypothetical protein
LIRWYQLATDQMFTPSRAYIQHVTFDEFGAFAADEIRLHERGPAMGKRISRRQLLMGSATLGGGLVLAAQDRRLSEAAEAPEHPKLIGTIVAVQAPSTVIVRGNGLHTAVLTEDAELWRDAPVALEAYVPGDEVGLFGAWDGGRFIATRMETVYRYVEAKVLRRRGDRLELSTGPLVVTSDSQVDPRDRTLASLDHLRAGDRVLGSARWEPALQELVAVRLSTHVH